MDTTIRYDTAKVAPRDRFAFWRDAVCESFVRLGCETENLTRFKGLLKTTQHSMLSISEVSGLAHTVDRRPSDIRTASEEYFLLSLETGRGARISQFGAQANLRPGDMVLYDSTSPYRLELNDGFSQMVVQLPKERLLARFPNARMVAGHRIDGQSGLGQLVRDNILAFSHHAGTDDPTLQAMVQETLIDLIATGLASVAGGTAELSAPDRQVLLRTKAWIASQLGNPDLDRTMVAAAMGLSVRRLNSVFAKEGSSLSGFIRVKRLDAAAADLRDKRCSGLTVSEIALRNGFSNFQHFSTAFKRHHGLSPRDWRNVGAGD
ncbi:helix-turn-helix domain-containing protein [Roseibium sp.]|uniref:AraC-like ligand-binding domain-containing protein n=1 Tax=Roseibium sp. TaxID=1936156 RepID=UPI003D146663